MTKSCLDASAYHFHFISIRAFGFHATSDHCNNGGDGKGNSDEDSDEDDEDDKDDDKDTNEDNNKDNKEDNKDLIKYNKKY